MTDRRPGDRAAFADQALKVSRIARAAKGSHAVLQDPQAHDIAQVADRTVDPTLVGEVGPAALFGENGLLQLHAHQRPRPRGDEREALGRGGNGDDGGSRVVRADGCQVDRAVELGPRSTSGRSSPAGSPGWRRAGNSSRRIPNLVIRSVSQSPVTIDRSWVVEALVTSAPT